MVNYYKGTKAAITIHGATLSAGNSLTFTPTIAGGVEHSLGSDVGEHVRGPKTCEFSITRKATDDTLFQDLFIGNIAFSIQSDITGTSGVIITLSGCMAYSYERPAPGPGDTLVETLSGSALDWTFA